MTDPSRNTAPDPEPAAPIEPAQPMDDFKRSFFRGLAALLPTLLTIALLIWAYEFVDSHIGQPISRGLLYFFAYTGSPTFVDTDDALEWGTPIGTWLSDGREATEEYKVINHKALQSADDSIRKRAEHQRDLALWRIAFAKYKLHAIGFLIAIILVYFLGFFLASFLGRATLRIVENLIGRIPLVRAIYPNIKQVTDFLLNERQFEFSGVVAVQYPRKGVWAIGLLTGPPMKAIQDAEDRELVTIFVPSSPTPVTGYTITAPRDDVLVLDMSIDDALRFTISGGVIMPGAMMAANAQPPRLAGESTDP